MDLPTGLEHVRTTAIWNESTVPAALRSAHTVADNVWGRLVVTSGSLEFVFEDDPSTPRHVGPGEHQVIPPGRPHHVEVEGPVEFSIEFHR